jgi:hypothetical protein
LPRDAFDAAAELIATKRDQLRLAEQAKPYIEGEPSAVAKLRDEITALQPRYVPQAVRYTAPTTLQMQQWRRRGLRVVEGG